jgi:diguanylate cyclase (GGDEF)-like protein
VANVAHFYRELGRLEQNPVDFTVLVVDVDELKSINDRYGHQTGSAAIQTVANVLRHVVRGSHVLARYGGDEFVVILREADEAGARKVMQRIRGMLEGEILPGTLQQRVSVSVGWAIFGEDPKTSRIFSRPQTPGCTATSKCASSLASGALGNGAVLAGSILAHDR